MNKKQEVVISKLYACSCIDLDLQASALAHSCMPVVLLVCVCVCVTEIEPFQNFFMCPSPVMRIASFGSEINFVCKRA